VNKTANNRVQYTRGITQQSFKTEAGYTGDKDAKAVEEWEDMMAKRRGKRLNGLFGRLMR
jgi:hypothetical protein